jgi:hypothetical protein
MDRLSKETLKNVMFEDVIIIDVKIYAINNSNNVINFHQQCSAVYLASFQQ